MGIRKDLIYLNFLIFIVILFFANCNFAQAQKQKKGGTLFLDSDLDSVNVFINDSFVGITPLSLPDLPKGTYNINFVYDTLVIHKYNVEYQNISRLEVYGIFTKGKALLTVRCNEPKAGVFLNDSLIGYTPLIKKYVTTGVYNLSVRKNGFSTWEKRIIVHSSLYKFNAKIKYNLGYLLLIKTNSREKFYIDNKLVRKNIQMPISLLTGKHTIEVESIDYHKTFSETFKIFPKEKKNVRFNYGIKTYIPLLYSTLVPGLGQVMDNSGEKGYIIMATNVILGGLATYFILNYNNKFDRYKESIDLYKNEEFNIAKVLNYKRQMLKNYDETKKALKFKQYSIGVFLISYLYNLVDAYFYHSLGGEFIFSTDNNLKTSNILIKVRL